MSLLYFILAFKNHILERFNKADSKKQLKKMKSERKQRLALMWEQYEKTIHDLKEVSSRTYFVLYFFQGQQRSHNREPKS